MNAAEVSSVTVTFNVTAAGNTITQVVRAKADEVSVQAAAQASAQAATQAVAAAQTDAVAQTISAAYYSTAAGGMSPMALMPASDTSSAQGQQRAAKVVIREYERQRIKYNPGRYLGGSKS